MTEIDAAWTVGIPRPVDRRLHLGPFPSARDALKFAGYAAVGLVAVPVAGPVAVVPFALVGFVVAIHRGEGRPLDERVVGYLAWRWRRRVRVPSGASVGTPARAAARTMRVGSGRVAAVLIAGGVPVAYLPPADARALFEATRRWLAALDGPLYLVARSAALDPTRTVRPRTLPPTLPTGPRGPDTPMSSTSSCAGAGSGGSRSSSGSRPTRRASPVSRPASPLPSTRSGRSGWPPNV